MIIKNNRLIICFVLQSLIFGQNIDSEIKTFNDYQISSERYYTDDKGGVGMFVNVWGNVSNPGRHRVNDGVDFATLLAIVGGPNGTANLKEVTLYREIPENGQLKYQIDIEDFIKTGDRSNFIEIKPNDTIMVPTKISSVIWSQMSSLNTIFSLLNLYLTLELRLNK
tara:strand:- start:87 stop:587 length:501 start_codon:yes stop_codon:yes gene_type:complete